MVTNSFGKKQKNSPANGKAQHALRNSPLFVFVLFPLFPSCRNGVPMKFTKGSRVPNIGSHQVLKHQIRDWTSVRRRARYVDV
jgi:hypothetical protein